MKASIFLFSGLVLFAGTALADTLETVFFRADMLAANESPAVTGVNATARAILSAHIRRNDAGAITGGFVDFDVDYNFTDADGTFSGLHIHDGAAGVNGPVTINTGLATAEAIAAAGTGNITRQATATSAAAIATLTSMLIDPSKHYVNIHTTNHAGGVLRAQLSRAEMRVSRVTMDPANEVPPVASDGKGSGNLIFLATRDANGNINAGTVSFETTYSFGSAVTFSGWHIHTGAAGINGAVVINTAISTSSADAQNVTSGTIRRRVEVTSGAALTALRGIYANAANYYLNIHTTTFAGGVMRGQLEDTVVNSYQISMTPANEVPAVTGLDASAIAKVSVYSNRNAAGNAVSGTVVFDVMHAFPASTAFTGLHIHTGGATVSGPVSINTGIGAGANSVTSATGAGNIYRTVDVSALGGAGLTALQGLLANPSGFYINLHTTTNAGGAVRGQIGNTLTKPAISTGAVLNNASYNLAGTSVAPGSIAAIFGTDMTNGGICLSFQGCNARLEAGKVSTSMGGTSVSVNGVNAPIYYITPGQIGFQIPVDVAGSSASVVVTAEGQSSAAQTVAIDPAAPGIFSATGDGRGAGAITHTSGFLVTTQNPATRGETLVLYATGLGSSTNPNLATGAFPTVLTRTTIPAVVTVGGIAAQVSFSGLSGCCAGLNQVNFVVPASAPTGGAVAVVLSMAAKQSNSVTIAIQ
ncbi:MAG: CHRD domain-containing protein [Bryobacteraceae bacterium]